MPTRNERREARPRAIGPGGKPYLAIIALTLVRVSACTRGDSLMTRETVFLETPVRRAMSLMVARLPSGRAGCGLSALLLRAGIARVHELRHDRVIQVIRPKAT